MHPLRHGGVHGSTGSKGRYDCCVVRSDRNIAAIARTVHRGAASRGRISQARPQFGRPGEHFDQRASANFRICATGFAGQDLTGVRKGFCASRMRSQFTLPVWADGGDNGLSLDGRSFHATGYIDKVIILARTCPTVTNCEFCASPRCNIGRMSAGPHIRG